jgi:uncharacterized membrane protein HdeD (DUF308 family)
VRAGCAASGARSSRSSVVSRRAALFCDGRLQGFRFAPIFVLNAGGTFVPTLVLAAIRGNSACSASLCSPRLRGSPTPFFLVSGVVRLAAAAERGVYFIPLLPGGIAVLLGLIAPFNIVTAALTPLGILVGVQLLVEGITLLLVGLRRRQRVRTAPAGEPD